MALNRKHSAPLRALDKIKGRGELSVIVSDLKKAGKKIVFTNGCFDLIHPGHIRYLESARRLGDILIVALNSDDSVRRLKGSERPFLTARERSEVVAALACVDLVTIFGEDTPQEIIEELMPHVLVKGGDWSKDQIVGRETVQRSGGQVIAANLEEGFSTSEIVKRIRCRGAGDAAR